MEAEGLIYDPRELLEHVSRSNDGALNEYRCALEPNSRLNLAPSSVSSTIGVGYSAYVKPDSASGPQGLPPRDKNTSWRNVWDA